jgi:hypothetical protein
VLGFGGLKYSIGAGFCAALASTFGKLAMNEIFLHNWLHNALIPEGAFLNTVGYFFQIYQLLQMINFLLSSDHDWSIDSDDITSNFICSNLHCKCYNV